MKDFCKKTLAIIALITLVSAYAPTFSLIALAIEDDNENKDNIQASEENEEESIEEKNEEYSAEETETKVEQKTDDSSVKEETTTEDFSGAVSKSVKSVGGSSNAVEKIEITDPGVIDFLNENSVYPDENNMYKTQDLASIERDYIGLSYWRYDVKTPDLTGLEYITSLRQINIDNAEGDIDFSNLANLPNLNEVNVGGNVEDISSLKYLTQIKTLIINKMHTNSITDFSFLSELNFLDLLQLYIYEDDISGIGELTNLKRLGIFTDMTNRIPYDEINKLTNLEDLCIGDYNNSNIDLSKISNLTNLNRLEIQGYRLNLNTINCLSQFDKLERLVLPEMNCQDLSFLKDLNNLKSLLIYFDTNYPIDTNTLSQLTDLTTLEIVNFDKDIEWIENLTKLEYLELRRYSYNTIELDEEFFEKVHKLNINDIRIFWSFNVNLGELENNTPYEINFEDIPILKETIREDCKIFGNPYENTPDVYISESDDDYGCVQIDLENKKLIVTPTEGNPKRQRIRTKYGTEIDLIWGNPGDNEPVELDQKVKNALPSYVDKDGNGIFTRVELEEANTSYLYINCNGQNVDLNGVEYLKNLSEIVLSNVSGDINFSKLDSLPELDMITIYGNPRDISTLGNLKQLKELTLSPYMSSISNLDFLKSMDSLEDLRLQNVDENCLKEIGDLKTLKSIDINSWNSKIDCSYFSSLDNIESIKISSNNITNIEALNNLSSLKRLSINSEKADISGIEELNDLKELEFTGYLNDNAINSINKLTTLKKLTIHTNDYDDNNSNSGTLHFNGLSSLEILEIYNYSNNFNTDFEGIENLENLNTLRIMGYKADKTINLNNIKQLPNLIELEISQYDYDETENKIDIESVANPNIKYFSITGNIDNVNPLIALQNLENVNIHNHYIDSNIEDFLDDLEKINASKSLNISYSLNDNIGAIVCGETKEYDFKTHPLIARLNDTNSPFYSSSETLNVREYDYYPTEKDKSEVTFDDNKLTIKANEFGDQCVKYEFTRGDIYDNSTKYAFDFEIVVSWKNAIVAEKTPVDIPDENLRKVILEEHDIDNDKTITLNDLMNIETLNITQKGVSSLEGIQKAQNLRKINANYNNIASLDYIKELKNLESFNLDYNQITDISDLINMDNISFGALRNNFIQDISAFKDNTQMLENFELSANYIDINESKNREVFDQLPVYLKQSLRKSQKYGSPEERDDEVEIPESIKNKLTEMGVSPKENGKFTKGILNDFNSRDAGIYEEYSLDLSNMNLSNNDIENLKYLSFLSEINLSNNKLTDASPLAGMVGLNNINLSNNKINPDTLANVYMPDYLDLSYNNISDISVFSDMDCWGTSMYWYGMGDDGKFVNINISHNNIKDITPINDVVYLKYLDATYNKIEDITTLMDYDFGSDNMEDDNYYFYKDPFRIDFSYNYIKGDNQETDDVIELFNSQNATIITENQYIDLIDEETNVEVSTFGDAGIKIKIEEIDKEEERADVVIEKIGDDEVVFSADVSIIEGEYSGTITVRIPVDSSYNGKKVNVIHLKDDGTVEVFEKRVEAGYVTVEVEELSPFYVTYNSENQALKGDVNGDGKVSLVDYGLVLAHVKRTKLLEGEQLERADVNGDNKVSLVDYGLILAHVKRTKLLF